MAADVRVAAIEKISIKEDKAHISSAKSLSGCFALCLCVVFAALAQAQGLEPCYAVLETAASP